MLGAVQLVVMVRGCVAVPTGEFTASAFTMVSIGVFD